MVLISCSVRRGNNTHLCHTFEIKPTANCAVLYFRRFSFEHTMRLHKLLKSIVLSVVSGEVWIRMGKQQADHL